MLILIITVISTFFTYLILKKLIFKRIDMGIIGSHFIPYLMILLFQFILLMSFNLLESMLNKNGMNMKETSYKSLSTAIISTLLFTITEDSDSFKNIVESIFNMIPKVSESNAKYLADGIFIPIGTLIGTLVNKLVW